MGKGPMEKLERIVLHIPHASPVFPFGRSGWEEGIRREIGRWTDWYTDWLFASASRLDPRIIPVSYPFSRFFCDVERLEDDPLEAVGQGIVYERFGGLKRSVSEAERVFALRSYKEHHDRLRRAITGERTLLVDCHSFPPDLSDVEVCIGVNEDWSRPEGYIIDGTVRKFSSLGYKVGINTPYSNSMAPLCTSPYSSMMLEINKKTYLQAAGELDQEKGRKLRNTIEMILLSMLTE